ncbi:hypothetical protein J6590_022784 [Homalodisca vitripennis]|nr:hypothetical protein J6590_022784 [Homalodisca vitripennis]
MCGMWPANHTRPCGVLSRIVSQTRPALPLTFLPSTRSSLRWQTFGVIYCRGFGDVESRVLITSGCWEGRARVVQTGWFTVVTASGQLRTRSKPRFDTRDESQDRHFLRAPKRGRPGYDSDIDITLSWSGGVDGSSYKAGPRLT